LYHFQLHFFNGQGLINCPLLISTAFTTRTVRFMPGEKYYLSEQRQRTDLGFYKYYTATFLIISIIIYKNELCAAALKFNDFGRNEGIEVTIEHKILSLSTKERHGKIFGVLVLSIFRHLFPMWIHAVISSK
jgi:hypothetical protein